MSNIEISEFLEFSDRFPRFHKAEENHLSYDLGYLCVEVLAQDYNTFRELVLKADAHDGGEAAARKYYGHSLGFLIAQFLGKGDWSPRPDEWDCDQKVLPAPGSLIQKHFVLIN